MYGISLLLSAVAVIGGTAAGWMVKDRMHRQVKILRAAAECVGQMLYLLKSGCCSSMEILSSCAKSKVGQQLPCLMQTYQAVNAGEDLYQAWAENLSAFCAAHRIEQKYIPLLQEMVNLLGSMDYMTQCEAYQALSQRLMQAKQEEETRYQKNGVAAVKIGLLGGLGIGLLLWKP